MYWKIFLLLISLISSPNIKNLSAEMPLANKSVRVWNNSGVIITLCLKNKVNCYEGHPCCNWQAYRWIGIDKNIVIDVGKGEILNFRYNKAEGDVCAAGTVEFVLADNPGQKSDIYLY